MSLFSNFHCCLFVYLFQHCNYFFVCLLPIICIVPHFFTIYYYYYYYLAQFITICCVYCCDCCCVIVLASLLVHKTYFFFVLRYVTNMITITDRETKITLVCCACVITLTQSSKSIDNLSFFFFFAKLSSNANARTTWNALFFITVLYHFAHMHTIPLCVSLSSLSSLFHWYKTNRH